jgi:GNAT superfamily N-acetyltransferase
MKNLLYILILTSQLVLSSEQNRKEYTKDTCNRTYIDNQLRTEEDRKKCWECSLSRFEVRNKGEEEYFGHIAYNPSICRIKYLLVDEKYRKEGIGAKLVKKAIEDMRTNHNCEKISLLSAPSAERFWKKLGAEAEARFDRTHVFHDPLLTLSQMQIWLAFAQ